MIKVDGGASMQCHFCDIDYVFTVKDLEEVIGFLDGKKSM